MKGFEVHFDPDPQDQSLLVSMRVPNRLLREVPPPYDAQEGLDLTAVPRINGVAIWLSLLVNTACKIEREAWLDAIGAIEDSQ